MTNTITINNQDLALRQYKGQMVVTFKDIDLVHNRPAGTAKRNFSANREHFIEGEDYFKVSRNEIRTNKIQGISDRCYQDVVLITESGYLMLVKSFTDDLSWEVQRQLVKTYFRYKEQPKLPNPDKPYEYFDKTYNGVSVLTAEDIEQITGINRSMVDYFLKHKAKHGKDYYQLIDNELKKFKAENPRVVKFIKRLNIITREGFIKFCRAYGIKVEEPKCFEVKSTAEKPVQGFSLNRIIEKLRREYGYDISVKMLTQEIADDYTDGVIRNQSLTVRQDDKYYIFVDSSAPLPNKRFLVAQGIGCVIGGQLRGNRKCLVTDYSQSSLSFASALMALSFCFDN